MIFFKMRVKKIILDLQEHSAMVLFQMSEAKFALCRTVLLLRVISRLAMPNTILIRLSGAVFALGSSVFKTLHKHELIHSTE